MPRRAARTDNNQTEILDGLEADGYGVLSLAALGKGTPDALIGAGKTNVLLEIKNPDRAKCKQGRVENETRRRQIAWRQKWPGPAFEVFTLEEAREILQRYGGPA